MTRDADADDDERSYRTAGRSGLVASLSRSSVDDHFDVDPDFEERSSG